MRRTLHVKMLINDEILSYANSKITGVICRGVTNTRAASDTVPRPNIKSIRVKLGITKLTEVKCIPKYTVWSLSGFAGKGYYVDLETWFHVQMPNKTKQIKVKNPIIFCRDDDHLPDFITESRSFKEVYRLAGISKRSESVNIAECIINTSGVNIPLEEKIVQHCCKDIDVKKVIFVSSKKLERPGLSEVKLRDKVLSSFVINTDGELMFVEIFKRRGAGGFYKDFQKVKQNISMNLIYCLPDKYLEYADSYCPKDNRKDSGCFFDDY